MRFNVSIRHTIYATIAIIRKKRSTGFLIIEALIGLTTLVVFSFIIMIARTQLAAWHMQAYQYLHASSIADRTFERIVLKQSIPKSVEIYSIKTTTAQDKKVPYKHIHIQISWRSSFGHKKELNLYGGIVDET